MKKLNVLLLGSGGREHAFAWKISQSNRLEKLFIAPGNPGTGVIGENHPLDLMDNGAVVSFIIKHKIDLVVVGPEAPLVNGIHNAIKANKNTQHVHVIGPKSDGAQLEGSKDFSKKFMLRNNVPTADYQTFTKESLIQGKAFLASLKAPYVLKCDGLAAGKGVLIIQDLIDAQQNLEEILVDDTFGMAGAKVVVEEFLDGIELSTFILTDGKDYLLLPTAKDYKRIGVGDTGLNTGGMGALSPAPVADSNFMEKVKTLVIDRTLKGLQKDRISFDGFLFIGLMRVGDEPYVIEYNVRMGDPETEAVLPLIDSDLLAHFEALGRGTLSSESLIISTKQAATIMMVSGGYPGGYEKGKEITGLDLVDNDSLVFQAGTGAIDKSIITNGGRVLTVTSVADTLEIALANSYRNLAKIAFEGSYFRTDIGYELKEKA